MIIQIRAGWIDGLFFTVHRNEYERALAVLRDQVLGGIGEKLVGDPKIAKVSVVGIGMRSHVGRYA
jgi:aspartate kinase